MDKFLPVLNSVQTKLGNIIELVGEADENNVLIIGVVHGDEPQGKYLIEKYLRMGKRDRQGNNLLFIPCLNPDGMQNGTRTNANGVDLNRNFPTENWGKNMGDNATSDEEGSAYFGGNSAGSEVETQFLIDTIKKYSPKLVVTLHTPYKIVNYDGPAKDVAKMISGIIGYPVEESVGYPTPGSFGTYLGVERNIPVITLEMDEECPVEDLANPIFEIFEELLTYDLD